MSNTKYNIILHSINYLHFNSFLILLFIECLIISIKTECERDKPIFTDGECTLKYCPEEDYNNSICIISNEIIKIQWITNIIQIGDLNFRYVNFANFSNGDMIVESSVNPGSLLRMFFGLKSNGLPLLGKHIIIQFN